MSNIKKLNRNTYVKLNEYTHTRNYGNNKNQYHSRSRHPSKQNSIENFGAFSLYAAVRPPYNYVNSSYPGVT